MSELEEDSNQEILIDERNNFYGAIQIDTNAIIVPFVYDEVTENNNILALYIKAIEVLIQEKTDEIIRDNFKYRNKIAKYLRKWISFMDNTNLHISMISHEYTVNDIRNKSIELLRSILLDS